MGRVSLGAVILAGVAGACAWASLLATAYLAAALVAGGDATWRAFLLPCLGMQLAAILGRLSLHAR